MTRARWIPLNLGLENVTEPEFYRALAQRLVVTVGGGPPPDLKLRCARESSPTSPPYGKNPFVLDHKAITAALEARGKRPVKLVFLLDEIDVLNAFSYVIKVGLRALFNDVPEVRERIRAVLCGFHLDRSASGGRSPPFNFLQERPMKPFNK
jgi:hypothetical protein